MLYKDELSIVEKIKKEKTENMSKGLFRIHLPCLFFFLAEIENEMGVKGWKIISQISLENIY